METFYLGIVVFLFMLAIFDLMVGVSNDAVNFLSSAVGAKVASFKKIILVAAIGVLLGAVMSNGMMEIARNGIFRPEFFTFRDVMCIFLAVMVTDVLLLDIFNSLGMPTSTTVSMVFELLGGAFIIALLKSADGSTSVHFADLLNTGKALSVIMAIFVSVAIAFFFGALVQFLARLVFTFNYKKNLRWTIGLFGGIAVTAIIYFMLIKGMKDASFMTAESKAWVNANTGLVLLGCLALFTAIMQILHWCRVNVFKVIVMLGTFALAMAFAGNDLVNFIGVPLAGYASYTDYAAQGNGTGILMSSLNGPARTPFIFLLSAGAVMVFSLYTSKKAKKVIQTSVGLSRQDEGEELFGSSALSRGLVRISLSIANALVKITPAGLRRWIGKRFSQDDAVLEEGAAFDLVRASVNLLLASLLIALGTSLKLPLSTTYVTFMVAMGTSLADRAWGRESAVFRITGVLSVIGGWFLTAGAAFTCCAFAAVVMYYGGPAAMLASVALTVFLLLRSSVRYGKKVREEREEEDVYRRIIKTEDRAEAWNLLKHYTADSVGGILAFAEVTYHEISKGFMTEDRKVLQRAFRTIGREKDVLRRFRKQSMLALRHVDRNLAMEKNTWLHLQCNCCEQFYYALKRMGESCKEHVDNHFSPMPQEYLGEFMPLRGEISSLVRRAGLIVSEEGRGVPDGDDRNGERNRTLLLEGEALKKRLSELRKVQMVRIQDEHGPLKAELVYLNLLQESQELVDGVRHLLRANAHFRQ